MVFGYNQDDFNSYLKIWQFENADDGLDEDEMFENYGVYKLYSQYVDKYNVKLPSGDAVPMLLDDVKSELENQFNLTEEEYMRVKTEIATVDYLFQNLQDYWKVPEEEYNTHMEGNEDKFKMYDYRVMQIAIEPATKSGDTSGNSSFEARRLAAKSKAVEALTKVKMGDNFEDVAKEYGKARISYLPSGMQIVNGTLESVSGLYMNEYIYDVNISEALESLEKGEYSEIYEGEDNYTFVYLENIRDGLLGADKITFIRQIANESIQNDAIIVDNRNDKAYKTYKYRRIQVPLEIENLDYNSIEYKRKEKEAKQRIEEAHKKIKDGVNPEVIARKYSQGSGKLEIITGLSEYANHFNDINIGECSDIHGYWFIYMEDIIDGITQEEYDSYLARIEKIKL